MCDELLAGDTVLASTHGGIGERSGESKGSPDSLINLLSTRKLIVPDKTATLGHHRGNLIHSPAASPEGWTEKADEGATAQRSSD